jgi:hypothetical protein
MEIVDIFLNSNYINDVERRINMDTAFGTIVDTISEYPLQDQEMILDILSKRVIEEKRELLFKDYKKAMRDYSSGDIKSGTVDDIFDSIND